MAELEDGRCGVEQRGAENEGVILASRSGRSKLNVLGLELAKRILPFADVRCATSSTPACARPTRQMYKGNCPKKSRSN